MLLTGSKSLERFEGMYSAKARRAGVVGGISRDNPIALHTIAMLPIGRDCAPRSRCVATTYA